MTYDQLMSPPSSSYRGDKGDPGIGYYLGDSFSKEMLLESVRNLLKLASIDKLSDQNGNTWYKIPYYGLSQIEKLASEYEDMLTHKAD